MKKTQLSWLSLFLFSGSVAAEEVILRGVFLDAETQSNERPLIVIEAKNKKLAAQLPSSQSKVAMDIDRGANIAISCPKDTVVKTTSAPKIDYQANNCKLKSINAKKVS
jgi:hypothetical protein